MQLAVLLKTVHDMRDGYNPRICFRVRTGRDVNADSGLCSTYDDSSTDSTLFTHDSAATGHNARIGNGGQLPDKPRNVGAAGASSRIDNGARRIGRFMGNNRPHVNSEPHTSHIPHNRHTRRVHRCRFENYDIDAISSDSRILHGHSIFCALIGAHADGHAYIDHAVAQGVRVIVHSRKNIRYHAHVTYVFCRKPQLFMSACAHVLYGRPSEKMCVIGVTGTDGKSTTVFMIYQLLKMSGVKCGMLSTVANDIGSGIKDNHFHQTTPQAPQLHKALASMHAAGCTHAVIETSSHALDPRTSRVAHVYYNGAIITNISNEHLDFHGTRSRYIRTKGRLLALVRRTIVATESPSLRPTMNMPSMPRNTSVSGTTPASSATESTTPATITASTNTPPSTTSTIADTADAHIPIFFALTATTGIIQHYLKYISPIKLHYYNINTEISGLSLKIDIHARTLTHTQLRIRIPPNEAHSHTKAHADITIPFFGEHNVQNLVGALCSAHIITQHPIKTLAHFCKKIALPAGRLQRVSRATDSYNIYVDYAHTAASLEKILHLFHNLSNGRLLILFGSAGERDKHKRMAMGRIAARYAHSIYICDEDPRGEDRAAIAHDIMRGIKHEQRNQNLQQKKTRAMIRKTTYIHTHATVHIILDREEAIAHAIAALRQNDTLLLLGKGHEKNILYADRTVEWDEACIAKKYLR